jgi:transposase
MGRKEDVPNRRYTLEYKIEAVRLAESIGGSEAAKRLEIPDSSLWNWIRLSRAGKLQAGDRAGTPAARRAPTELEAENARLRRELADTKLDVEVLKKAAAYFARGSR